MKTLYLDVFSGISGDMFLGALIDLGVDFQQLERELKKLNVEGYHLQSGGGQRSHIQGTKFDVHLEHDHDHEDEHDHEHHDHDHGHHHDVHEHGHHHGHKHKHAHEEHEHGRN